MCNTLDPNFALPDLHTSCGTSPIHSGGSDDALHWPVHDGCSARMRVDLLLPRRFACRGAQANATEPLHTPSTHHSWKQCTDRKAMIWRKLFPVHPSCKQILVCRI